MSVLALAPLAQPTAASAAPVQWDPAQQVSQHAPLGPPDVAVAPRTGTGVVWTAGSAGGTDVRFRQRTPDGVWHRVRSLGRGGGPQIGMDGSGGTVVVWHRMRPGRIPEIVAARRTVGGTWSTPRVLSRTAARVDGVETAPTDLHLAVSSGGAAVAAWRWGDDQDGGGPAVRVQAAYRPAGGRWHGPTDLTTPRVCTTGVATAIGPRGRATVVCLGSGGVRAIRHLPGGWTTPAVVSGTTGTVYSPDVAVGPSGGTVAVWTLRVVPEEGADPTYTIETSRLSSSWSAPTPVAVLDDERAAPRVALAGGVTTVVWADAAGVLRSARRASWAEPFGVPSTLSTPAVLPSRFELATDALGDLVVAWTRSAAQGAEKVAVTRPADGDWTDPVVLSGTDPVQPEEEAVGVTMGRCGRAFVAWQDTRTRVRHTADCTR